MEPKSILGSLRRLELSHGEDGDGGYALVRAIGNWASELHSADKERLWRVLVELFDRQDATLWGVALEVLVQDGSNGIDVELSKLIAYRDRSPEWNDQLILALLRLRYRPLARHYANYILEALRKGRRAILPLLAALCRVDQDACLELASNYFGEVLQSEELSQQHRGYISAFVRNFVEIDEKLLRQLLERTRAINADSARELAEMIDDYLARPMFTREVGEAKVRALRREVAV